MSNFPEEKIFEKADNWIKNNKKVSFAALDVYENEPVPNIQLLMHDKISLSPHIGGSTVEAQERIGDEIVKEIKSFYKLNE